jgi:hypothetical protein
MPKGTQRSNREQKKPKKDKKPTPAAGGFIPAQAKAPGSGSGKK